MSAIVSIDGIGSLAALRSNLEQGEQGACFGLDIAVVTNTPFKHFIGVDMDLFDAARINAARAQGVEHLLDKLDIRFREIVRSADFEEARVVFWPRPNNSDDFIHGYLLSVVVAQSTVAEAGGATSALGGGLFA